MRFSGIFAPLTTPFDHRGAIYWSKFDYNLAQLRRTKLSGFVVGDRWGEGPLLAATERVAVWKRAADAVGEDGSVLASVSDCGVAVAREAVSAAAANGCSAAILEAPDLSPLAPAATPAELFFRAVADSAELPLLASVSLNSANAAGPEMLAKLAGHPRMVGAVLDDCSSETVRNAVEACGPDFAILVRDFKAAAQCLAAGASAAVLAVASTVPFFALSIEEAVRTREHDAAASLTARALDFEKLLAAHGVPALKRAQDFRSFYGGLPRLPLLGVNPNTAAAISRALYELAS